MSLIDDIATKTDQELAQWLEDVKGRTGHELLANIEFQRRLIKEQHKLNKENVQLSAKYAVACAIIGVIFGAALTLLSGYLLK
jgi:hypothetical protein